MSARLRKAVPDCKGEEHGSHDPIYLRQSYALSQRIMYQQGQCLVTTISSVTISPHTVKNYLNVLNVHLL